MNLLSAIPGLSAHLTEAPSPAAKPVVVSFDNSAAYDLIRNAVNEVGIAFPAPDPWGWLLANRPEIISELKRVGNDMNVAYFAEDMSAVKAAAEVFVKYHLKAWKIYEERPPVIERQESLLEAA